MTPIESVTGLVCGLSSALLFAWKTPLQQWNHVGRHALRCLAGLERSTQEIGAAGGTERQQPGASNTSTEPVRPF
jgi:hypothetical protein